MGGWEKARKCIVDHMNGGLGVGSLNKLLIFRPNFFDLCRLQARLDLGFWSLST